MPSSAAEARAIPTSPTASLSSPTSHASGSPSSNTNGNGFAPPWVRPSHPSRASRRLSSRPHNLDRASSQQQQPFTTDLLRTGVALVRKARSLFYSLPLWQRALAALAALLLLALAIVSLVYSHRILAALGPMAQWWREFPLGWLILWVFTFATAFPPMVGYSSAVAVAGFVYGFPLGWPIVATASVAGSLAAFLTSRGIFSGYVHRLVGADARFVALGQVLRRDGLGMLTMIRVCPLPFSLSNGFLATIPTIRPWAFAVATALASPKLAVHVFIGSRLARLVEEGETMSSADKAINYTSMVVGGLVGLTVGLLIYKRTMARAAEIAREEAEEIAAATGGGDDDEDDDYADDSEGSRLISRMGGGVNAGGDEDAAALMDEDDISLWETDGDGYRDSWGGGDEEAAIEGKGVGVGSRNGAAAGNGVKK